MCAQLLYGERFLQRTTRFVYGIVHHRRTSPVWYKSPQCTAGQHAALLAKDQRLPTQMPCTCRNVQTSPQIAAQQRTKKLFNPFINVWISHGETLTTWHRPRHTRFAFLCALAKKCNLWKKITENASVSKLNSMTHRLSQCCAATTVSLRERVKRDLRQLLLFRSKDVN